MNIVLSIVIAIGLSIDAFSLALSIGTENIPVIKELKLSLITGLFHFFMPLIGYLFGIVFKSLVNVNVNLLSSIIFLFICYEMIKDYKDEYNSSFDMSIIGMIIFAFGVSLDSFGVGITFVDNNKTFLIYSGIFALCSFLFTFIGLIMGNLFLRVLGKRAKILGIIIMFYLSITNIVNFFN